jgi:hypothetical protein
MEKKSVGLLELEMAVLECFLEKTPLSPLGVNQIKAKISSPCKDRCSNRFAIRLVFMAINRLSRP